MLDCKWRGGAPGHAPDFGSSAALQPPAAGEDGRGDDPTKRSDAYEIAHFAMKRHGDRVVGCFIDGHAEAFSPTELWGFNWSVNYDPNYGRNYLDRFRNSTAAWMY
jgi:prepilin-type processing-associated H-X9-DG protein